MKSPMAHCYLVGQSRSALWVKQNSVEQSWGERVVKEVPQSMKIECKTVHG